MKQIGNALWFAADRQASTDRISADVQASDRQSSAICSGLYVGGLLSVKLRQLDMAVSNLDQPSECTIKIFADVLSQGVKLQSNGAVNAFEEWLATCRHRRTAIGGSSA